MRCEGCEKLRVEMWPRNQVALRCMGRGLREREHPVMTVCSMSFAPTAVHDQKAPVWCEKNDARREYLKRRRR